MFFMCLVALLAAGTSLKAQEVTITLMPGWTWISIPSTETMDFATALGSFTPAVGDRIKSQWGNATYRGNGEWRGQISEFYPGYGYKYYSTRQVPVSVTFNAQQASSQVVVSTSEPMLITAISAMGGGEVTTTDGTYIIVKGLCWAAHENPTTNDDFYEEAESGVGTFSISMTELNIATTYYVRAYAVTPNGTVYGDQKSFTTRDGIPEVTTDSVTNISGDGASCYGTVTDNGGLNVIARGVCWSTEHNPTVSDSHTTNGSGLGSFTSRITGLNGGTTYYVRAYASTSQGTGYGEDVSIATPLSVVLDSITYIFGDVATCHGLINVHDPSERGICWSTSHNPTIDDNHFIEYPDYDIYIGDEEGQGGGVDYEDLYGNYTIQLDGLCPSTTYYVRSFIEKHNSYAYSNEISFTTPATLGPDGVLPGTFSVSANQQVHFSQGNLQYKASTNTWRFARYQWSYVGGFVTDDWYYDDWGNVYNENGTKCHNNYISSSYSGWIDLFGWGTSGYDHGAVCYQPWSTSSTQSDYYAYGQSSYNLYDQIVQADWGYNPISNGGDQPNQWRTLTKDEWVYIFNTRNTPSGIRYAKACVNGINGVILLPDDWSTSYYSLNNTNGSGASFNSNMITASQWSLLEQHGAVFLPETGLRRKYSNNAGEQNFEPGKFFYWSSSSKTATNAWHLMFNSTGVYPQDNSGRHNGMAVRLVCFTTQDGGATVTTNEVSDITYCQATCGGTMIDDGGNEATVRGVCWSTSPNPTVVDAHTIDGSGMGSFTSTMTELMPSTTYYVRAYATNRLSTVYGNEVSFTTAQSPNFTISVSANPTDGGTVSGEGVFTYGQSCSVHAIANTGYNFFNWTENGNVVSTDADYTFMVTDGRTLIANFLQDVIIGSGSSTNAYLPTNAHYNYSLTEQIYIASEIGRAGTITSISFKVSNSKSTTRYVVLYMKHTTKTTFTSRTGWETLSSSNKVYSGSVTFNASGWTTITLDTPFVYNGTSNLVIGIDDNTGSYVSSSNSPQFYVYNTGANRALRIYSDGTNYDPSNSSSYSGTYVTSNNQIVLRMGTAGDL